MSREDEIQISRAEYHELKSIIGRLQMRGAELVKENQRLREALEEVHSWIFRQVASTDPNEYPGVYHRIEEALQPKEAVKR